MGSVGSGYPAWMVNSSDVPVVLASANWAVTFFGSPLTARATGPVMELSRANVTVSVPE